MKRVFIGLPIEPKIGSTLIPLQNGLDGAKFSPIENFHITLRFIGDLSETNIVELDDELANIKFEKFQISMSQIGFFGGDKPHSIHVLIDENQKLQNLHEKCDSICKKMGISKDHKKYVPHVTLAYLKHTTLIDVVAFQARHNLFKSKKWIADRFYLYSSHIGNGPSKYIIEAEYPLSI